MASRSVRFLIACSAGALCVAPALIRGQSVAVGVETGRESAVGSRTLVTVNVDAAPLKLVLQQIARQSGLTPYYGDAVQQSARKVTLHVRDIPVASAFTRVLHGTGLKATIVADRVAFEEEATVSTSLVEGGISGKVFDDKTKQPLRRVTITMDGAGRSVLTGDDGAFRLSSIAPGAHTMHLRLLGYVKATKVVTVVEGQMATIDIALEPSVSALDQVVVTGTVTATAQKAVPNAMTVITAKDIEARGITRVDQLFRGDIPGLFAVNYGSGDPLDKVTMFSRGATKMQTSTGDLASNTIKTYVDGIELANPSYLSQIDPKSIERIEILTGPQASTVYGSNAINGVMQIFTKRGTSVHPQLTATLLSGLVQNNFTTALTPQHDYSAQINGTDARWSYNTGGSWTSIGAWTPARQTDQLSGFGGIRVQAGVLTADGSLRLAQTHNMSRGSNIQALTAGKQTGLYTPDYTNGLSTITGTKLSGQTYGLTLSYTPTSWWSHEIVLGDDDSDVESLGITPGYTYSSDTLRYASLTHNTRRSGRYASTIHADLTSLARATVTVGADAWSTQGWSVSGSGTTTTGSFPSSYVSRDKPGRNHGGFLQGQIGLADAMFVTLGLRAEWNPNYGAEAQPNFAPRYGVAYTRDLTTPWGSMTAKLRASYGRSTRPPTNSQKLAVATTSTSILAEYAPFLSILANSELGPEYQQGGEGGIELYFGSRGSLVVTRYNQTVDGLITSAVVDSVRSLVLNPTNYASRDTAGMGYERQYQYLNIGSLRNQGWEAQGTINTGPFTTKGTYSWTKSRFLGIAPRYRSQFAGTQYQPGATFNYLPEHTAALNVAYAHRATTLAVNLNWASFAYRGSADWLYEMTIDVRLAADKGRLTRPPNYLGFGPGYMMADLNASHRFSPRVEGVLEIQNLSNSYQNDYSVRFVSLGRQSKGGLRIRL